MGFAVMEPLQFPLHVAFVADSVKTGLLIVTASVCAGDAPQELFAVTVTFPDAVPSVTFMDMVPLPEFMVAPVGTVHE